MNQNMSTEIENPLSANYRSDSTDAALVKAAVEGDRPSLEALVRRHQGFIYSLAQRMLYAPEDAADATQEILICIVTNLAVAAIPAHGRGVGLHRGATATLRTPRGPENPEHRGQLGGRSACTRNVQTAEHPLWIDRFAGWAYEDIHTVDRYPVFLACFAYHPLDRILA